jgi:hypothetical protein
LIWIRIANSGFEIVGSARLLGLKKISELTHIISRNVFHGGDAVKILKEKKEAASASLVRVYIILNEVFLLITLKDALKGFV